MNCGTDNYNYYLLVIKGLTVEKGVIYSYSKY